MRKVNQKRQFGQGMTEYIIIVALIAIAAITVYNLFGDTVRGQVGGMAAELGGGTASKDGSLAGGEANTEAGSDYTLENFEQSEAGK
ncbi:MAG: pilus assembly protein [Oceanococcus sp.]